MPLHPVASPSLAFSTLRRLPLCVSVLIACASAVWAQDTAAVEGDATELPEVVVTATRSAKSALDVPAAIDALPIDNIDQQRLGVNTSEALAGIPGVLARNRQNYAQDEQISIRGFGARSTFGVRGVRLYTDGIPATMPDGSGQVSHFNLDSAERIEVLRGPFSALYGNSSGGVIQLFTADGSAEPELRAGIVGGSYGVLRASANLRGSSGPVGYNIGISDFRTDGYRDHSEAKRRSGNVKVTWQVAEGSTLTMLANTVDIPWAQDPLGLTFDQFRADPRQATSVATQFNTRKDVSQSQGGLLFDQVVNANHSVRLLGYYGERSVVQFLAIPIATQANPLHAGGDVDLDGSYHGADARWNYANGPLELTVGVNAESQDQQRRGYENFVGSVVGVQGRLRRDEQNTVDTFDQYAQASWAFATDWSLMAGVRHSTVRFENADRYITASNPDDSGKRDYSATSPVVGLLYKPGVDSSIYATWGKGFETPTFAELGYRRDGGAGLNFGLEPARSRNAELGYKFRASSRLRGDIAVFRADTDNEIAVATNAGGRTTFRNVGEARREGVEAALTARLADRLSLRVSATWLDATFRTPYLTCTGVPCTNPTTPVTAGTRIPGVPEFSGRVALDWGGENGWRAGVAMDHVGDIAVNDTNTQFAPSYTVFGAEVGYAFSVASGTLRTYVRVDNLADKRYIGSVIVNDGNGRFYEPGMGRSALVGVQWLFAPRG